MRRIKDDSSISLGYLPAATADSFFCVKQGCAQERQPLLIPVVLRSINGEAGKLCYELHTGLQATSVRTSLFHLNCNRNHCEKNGRAVGAPSMRVTRGQPEACVGTSDFPQACVSCYRAFNVVIYGRQVTCPTTEVRVIYQTINKLCGPTGAV